jgi:Zn-dependent protease with chaperone function
VASLVFRSVLVLTLLFGLVFAVGMMVNVFLGLPTSTAVFYAVFLIFLEYLLGPFILEWLFTIKWVEPEDLSPELAAFAKRVCAEPGIPLIRFGLIDDGNPNAFTFGHSHFAGTGAMSGRSGRPSVGQDAYVRGTRGGVSRPRLTANSLLTVGCCQPSDTGGA